MSVIFNQRYPASASSVPLARHDVIDALTTAGYSDPDLQSRVALTLTEATGNVVRHAYPHGGRDACMNVVANDAAGAVLVVVTDHGVGVDARSELPGMGHGLGIMRAQTTSVEIDSATNAEIGSNTSGTIVTLRFGDG